MNRENPASLSPLMTTLFPPGVVAVELWNEGDASQLMPEETRQLGNALPKRQREFAAGRVCARRALAELGIVDFPLVVNADRRPRWPSALVGSITHTTGFCGAVVARREQLRGIGLDGEIVGQVTADLWPQICTPDEAAWLDTLPRREQRMCAALIFSAKEAFYKCQYGVTGQWLEFHDVTVDLRFGEDDAGSFAVRPRQRVRFLENAWMPAQGRFRLRAGLVLTGIVLE